MREIANTETVRAIYAALGRRDFDAVVERLDDTVVWIAPGWSASAPKLVGIKPVREFLGELWERVTLTGFETRDFIAQGNRVVALIHYEGRHNATGRSFSVESAMLWTIGNGKVVRVQEYTDTEALANAARPQEFQTHKGA